MPDMGPVEVGAPMSAPLDRTTLGLRCLMGGIALGFIILWQLGAMFTLPEARCW